MALTNPRCNSRNKIKTKAVHVTSLDKCLRRYRANKKTIIIVDTVLEVEIGPKATALGRCRNFVVSRFDLVIGAMKLATINIQSAKLHTQEPPCPYTVGDGGYRADSATTTTNGDTTVTYPVSVQVFEAPAPDPFNDELFRVVVAHPMAKMPGQPLSSLAESGGLLVWVV